jgi:hypothetical protein
MFNSSIILFQVGSEPRKGNDRQTWQLHGWDSNLKSLGQTQTSYWFMLSLSENEEDGLFVDHLSSVVLRKSAVKAKERAPVIPALLSSSDGRKLLMTSGYGST